MLLAFVKARLALMPEWREFQARRREATRKELLFMFEQLDRASFSMSRSTMAERSQTLVDEHLDRVLDASFPLDQVLEIAAKLNGG